MNERTAEPPRTDQAPTREAGQSIVLIALTFAALVAFLGLATDVGLAFVRSSQHSKSVDSASLAGVVDLTATIEDPANPGTNICAGIACSDLRAQQFLSVSGWPTETLSLFRSGVGLTQQGFPEYTITVTWPVDTFFLRILGIRSFDITHSASAAYYAQSDIIVPTAGDGGQIRKAPQFLVGDVGCSTTGDPVMPRNEDPATVNAEQAVFEQRYRYRVRVPAEYTQPTVIIELFDTDTANIRTGNAVTGFHSRAFLPGQPDLAFTQNCADPSAGATCVLETGESVEASFQNPLWFQRVDEIFDDSCNPLNTTLGNTVTRFHLFYVDGNGDVEDLAIYTDDNSFANQTDLRWITPCAGCGVDAEFGDFEVTLAPIPSIDGFQEIFLDVGTTDGTSRNVWDIWARPLFPDLPPLPTDVNERNLFMVNQPYNFYVQGVDVFAQGRMPLQHFISGEFTLQVTPLPIELGEGSIYASIYDYDVPPTWPSQDPGDPSLPYSLVNFRIDTLPTAPLGGEPLSFNIDARITDSTPDPANWEATCGNNTLNCSARWLRPQYQLGIDSDAYAGGTLQATYTPSADAMTWSIAVTAGRPFLTR